MTIRVANRIARNSFEVGSFLAIARTLGRRTRRNIL